MRHLENTIGIQLYSLFLFIIAGILIGIFFDIFRVLRRTFKTPDWITYLEDILFWILTGTFLLFLLFYFQNGEIRGYVILGLFFGILIYMLTISKHFIKISVNILNTIKSKVKQIILWCLKPFSIVWKTIHKALMKPISFMVINVRKLFTTFHKNHISAIKNKKIKNKRRNLQKNVEKYN